MSSSEAHIERQIKALIFALAHRKAEQQQHPRKGKIRPLSVITISRQVGSGGHLLGRRLAERLDFAFYDREILDCIANAAGIRKNILESFDDRTRSEIELWISSLLTGEWVDKHDYCRWLAMAIHSMAEIGDCVILGRAGNIILGEHGGFHVRVVAPADYRVKNLVTYDKLSLEEAATRVKESDKERRKFYAKCFDREIDDPLNYHLIINAERISLTAALDLVVAAWHRYLHGENTH